MSPQQRKYDYVNDPRRDVIDNRQQSGYFDLGAVMKTKKSITSEVTIINRQAIQRAGIDVPADWKLADHIDKIMPELSKEPQYVLWNGGELKVNKGGGTDCIAWLYIENDVLRGWSI